MCSDDILIEVIAGFGSNFNKRDGWDRSVYPTWKPVLAPYPDSIVWNAYIALVSKPTKFPPNIGDLKRECDLKSKELKVSIDTKRSFCLDCEFNGGAVYTHAGYYRTDKNHKWVQSTRMCSCTCDDSKEYHPGVHTWKERLALLEADPRVDLQVYLHTNRDRQYFTDQEIDPVQYDIDQQKEKDRPTSSKYRKILELMFSENSYLLLQDRQVTKPIEDDQADNDDDTRWQDSYKGYFDNPFDDE